MIQCQEVFMHKQIAMLTVLMICVLAASAHAAQISVEPAWQERRQNNG
jgi:hypothetical protein